MQLNNKFILNNYNSLLNVYEIPGLFSNNLYIAVDAEDIDSKPEDIKKEVAIRSYRWLTATIISLFEKLCGWKSTVGELTDTQGKIYYVNYESFLMWRKVADSVIGEDQTLEQLAKTHRLMVDQVIKNRTPSDIENLTPSGIVQIQQQQQHEETNKKNEKKELAINPELSSKLSTIQSPVKEKDNNLSTLPESLNITKQVAENTTSDMQIRMPEETIASPIETYEDFSPADKEIFEIGKRLEKLKSEYEELKKQNLNQKNKTINDEIRNLENTPIIKEAKKQLNRELNKLISDLAKERKMSVSKFLGILNSIPEYTTVDKVKNEEFEQLRKKHIPAVFALEDEQKIIVEKIERLNALEREIAQLEVEYPDKRDNLAKVQENALKGWTEELSTDPKADIKTIKTYFRNLKSQGKMQELQSYWIDYQKEIEKLQSILINKFRSEVHYQGVAAINRWFITTHQENLNNPDFLLALFALEAAGRKDLIKVFTGSMGDVLISSMIQNALDDPNAYFELSVLPPNTAPKKYPSLKSYLERKSFCGEKILAIHEAVKKIQKKDDDEISQIEISQTKNFERYAPVNWKNYTLFFEELIKKIKKYKQEGKGHKLLEKTGGHDYADLLIQCESRFLDLFNQSGLQAMKKGKTIKIDASLKEIAEKLSSSSSLLIPETSHGFDRLHLITSLINEEKYIELSDGMRYSNEDIFREVFAEFAQGVTLRNAIAAEQFYTRIVLTSTWIDNNVA